MKTKLFLLIVALTCCSSLSFVWADGTYLEKGAGLWGDLNTGETRYATNEVGNQGIPNGWVSVSAHNPSVYFLPGREYTLKPPVQNAWWAIKVSFTVSSTTWFELLHIVIQENSNTTSSSEIIGVRVNGQIRPLPTTLYPQSSAKLVCDYLRGSSDPNVKDQWTPVDLAPITPILNDAHLGVKKAGKTTTFWGSLKGDSR